MKFISLSWNSQEKGTFRYNCCYFPVNGKRKRKRQSMPLQLICVPIARKPGKWSLHLTSHGPYPKISITNTNNSRMNIRDHSLQHLHTTQNLNILRIQRNYRFKFLFWEHLFSLCVLLTFEKFKIYIHLIKNILWLTLFLCI